MYICCVPGLGLGVMPKLNTVIINLANYRPWMIMILSLLLCFYRCAVIPETGPDNVKSFILSLLLLFFLGSTISYLILEIESLFIADCLLGSLFHLLFCKVFKKETGFLFLSCPLGSCVPSK